MTLNMIYSYCLLYLFGLAFVICENEVPVIIWNSNVQFIKTHISALRKFSTSEFFNNYLKKLIADGTPILLGLETSLSLEDFRWQDMNGRSVFPLISDQIEHDGFVKIFPSVKNPFKSFYSLKSEGYELPDFNSSYFPDSSNTVFVLKLDDAKIDESRSNLLRRHDKIIYDACKLVEKTYGNAVCILTAFHQSWIEPEEQIFSVRNLLQADGSEKKPLSNVYLSPNIAIIYTKSSPYFNSKINGSSYKLSLEDHDSVTKAGNGISLYLKGVNTSTNESIRIRFVFEFSCDNVTWQLNNITFMIPDDISVRGTLLPSIPIQSSVGFSFHTPEIVMFQNENFTLIFNSIQVEYFNGIEHEIKFSVADDTVTFFTIPIISGLLITSLLVTIVLSGLSVIFDIKTMDLFDDPKGKTVTINATE